MQLPPPRSIYTHTHTLHIHYLLHIHRLPQLSLEQYILWFVFSYTYTYTHTHIFFFIHIHIHIHTYTHTHFFFHTHTHTLIHIHYTYTNYCTYITCRCPSADGRRSGTGTHDCQGKKRKKIKKISPLRVYCVLGGKYTLRCRSERALMIVKQKGGGKNILKKEKK